MPLILDNLEVEGTIISPSTVFGTNFQLEESLGESVTDSLVYVNKVTLETPVIPAGTYLISFTLAQGTDLTLTTVDHQITLDTVEVAQGSHHLIDIASEVLTSGFVVAELTNAVHTIELNHKTAAGVGCGSRVRDARIVIWRIL